MLYISIDVGLTRLMAVWPTDKTKGRHTNHLRRWQMAYSRASTRPKSKLAIAAKKGIGLTTKTDARQNIDGIIQSEKQITIPRERKLIVIGLHKRKEINCFGYFISASYQNVRTGLIRTRVFVSVSGQNVNRMFNIIDKGAP